MQEHNYGNRNGNGDDEGIVLEFEEVVMEELGGEPEPEAVQLAEQVTSNKAKYCFLLVSGIAIGAATAVYYMNSISENPPQPEPQPVDPNLVCALSVAFNVSTATVSNVSAVAGAIACNFIPSSITQFRITDPKDENCGVRAVLDGDGGRSVPAFFSRQNNNCYIKAIIDAGSAARDTFTAYLYQQPEETKSITLFNS